MKTKALLCVMILTTALNVVEAQGEELPISDKQNSGCLSMARGYEDEGEPIPTIILKKEGTILSVELQNYISNCATYDFEIKSSISDGIDGSPCSLSVNVHSVLPEIITTCDCPFNVSFTIRDFEPNSFYLDCWWYKGLVELTEGEPLVLEDVYEDATIDGMNFTLQKAFHQAMVTRSEWVGEVRIPSELSHEGQTYSVTSISSDAFTDNTTMTKVFIPRTIKNTNFSEESGFNRNLFSWCSALESIEVEEGNPVLCSVGGVLFNKEKTRLYTYPAADSRTSYTVPEGVTWIDGSAFASNHHLVSISLPDGVTSLGSSAFYDCTNLEEVNLPYGLKSLAGYLFWNCSSLTDIQIPKSVTSVMSNAFKDCKALKTLDLPESVTLLGDYVFSGCKLDSLIIRGVIDFSWNGHYWLFDGMGTETKVYVHPTQVDKFKAIYKGPVYPLPEQPVGDMTYLPFLEEGKAWTYRYYGNNGQKFNVDRVIEGDTIIGGLTYKRIYDKVGGQYQYALREEGKKIYIVYPHYETASLLYDFSKNAGDVINELAHPLIVASVDTIDIDGVKFRRMRVQDVNQPVEEWNDDLIHVYNFWIEGVGSESLLEASIREPGNAYNLVSCQINGRVYTQQELLGIVSKPTPQIAYRPMLEDGKVWKVGTIPSSPDSPVQIVDYYYFDGDTIIDGKTCKQMWCQRYVSPDYPKEWWSSKTSLSKVGAWYEEDKKVYCYDERKQEMLIKYDFSLDANDTLTIYDYNFVVGPKQTGGLKGFKGVYREIKWCFAGSSIDCTTWLEGVGGIDGPTINTIHESVDRSLEFLMSCTVGDEVIYFNDEYEDGTIPGGIEAAKKRFDFTHTTKLQPHTPRRGEEELSLYGEYNNLQLGIHLDPLDDAYQVSITNESGEAVYEKTINAGTIVGLSIDISAYAKGRYTVIVENSNEVFTGEFATETTGIEETIYNNKVKTRTEIYNLQGQRLSSLQKGLNIVNGQKVYVK